MITTHKKKPTKTGTVSLPDVCRGDIIIATLPYGHQASQKTHLRLEAIEDAHPELPGAHSEGVGACSCRFRQINGKTITLTDYPDNQIPMAYAPAHDNTADVYAMIRAERVEQIAYGFDADHDDSHIQGEIALGAAAFLLPPRVRDQMKEQTGRGDVVSIWPWRADQFHPSSDRIHELVKGAAMAIAEIERLQRVAQNEVQ